MVRMAGHDVLDGKNVIFERLHFSRQIHSKPGPSMSEGLPALLPRQWMGMGTFQCIEDSHPYNGSNLNINLFHVDLWG